MARRAVSRLDLAHSPGFTGAAAPAGLAGTFSTLWTGVMASVRQRIGHAPAATGTPSSDVSESSLISEFQGRVSVDPVTNSKLVDVGFVSDDPAFAARAVNALAEEYVQQNLELRQRNMLTSLEWISRELVTQQQKVESSERAMAEYRENQNALSLEERENIVVARLNQLNDAVTKAKTNRVQKEALYDQVRNLGELSPDTIPAILQNPYIQAIKTQLAQLSREKATLQERYGDKYPDVLKVNASLQDASQQLRTETAKAVDAIRNDYQSALAEERTLADALEEQKSAAMDLNRKSVNYTVLEREAHSNRQVYESLLQRHKELQVMAHSQGNNVRITEHAEIPGAPFVPTPRRDAILAIVAGFALSLGLVFLLDFLDDTVKNPDDVIGKLNMPLLGLAPAVAGGTQPILTHDVPHEFGEAFRSLRTALIFSGGRKPTCLVMVTSAQPLEGKTTTACNLALALAIGGARVLLVDADMRRPGVHRALGFDNRVGLSHVLAGQASFADALVAQSDPMLWVMPAGMPPPNPSELLGSDQMRALVDQTKSGRFDWVIFDTPPVLPVTDGVVLSSLVDGVAFVIGSEMTQRQNVTRAIQSLTDAGARVFGAVLSRVDLKRNRYYYARYYGYQSRSYFTPPAA